MNGVEHDFKGFAAFSFMALIVGQETFDRLICPSCSVSGCQVVRIDNRDDLSLPQHRAVTYLSDWGLL
ncbi:hypothetical protein [Bradyrhizobium sp. CCBAU 51753]|uniref:hypothetical protein n=1 Tax=Bradyrhizobium sp. CCBAU 51753 TaxID=1325100 RepID=UPI00188B1CDE|nr:hypothetical protein [Bradyrhizobium sp. CCBAU 51753]